MQTIKKISNRLGASALKCMMLLAFVLSGMAAQAAIVKGTVTDEAGEPLIGATVMVAGTNNGTATDFDGNFSIDVEQGKTIHVSYVGYLSQDVKVKGNDLKIVLKEDNALLDEVVVVGYGTMKRKDLTGSITTVNSKDLNVGSYTDPGQLLQGKVPGLVVVQNSDPNGGVNSLTLRGASTLNSSTEPLYVVDGIPGINLNLIPPSDIESIDVLRDASATAIYGSKAANGVIIVTTKRGSEGPARVSYQGYVSWEKVANDHKMMTATQLRDFAKDLGVEPGADAGGDTNWQDQVMRTGFAHNHNLSISGGGKSTTYNASVNYIERDGIIKGAGNNLFTARAYIETKTLKDRLTLAVGVNGNVRNEWGVSRDTQGRSVYQMMYQYTPLAPVYNEDGTYYSNSQLVSQSYNPLALITEDKSRRSFRRLQVTGKASLMIIDGLFLNANFSYHNENTDYKSYKSHQSPTEADLEGRAERSFRSDIKKLMEIYGNYDKEFGDDHKLALMAGYSWEQEDYNDNFGAWTYGYYNDALGWNNLGAAMNTREDAVGGFGPLTKRMISFYGRANYSFKSRYLVQAAVRRDGASSFGANHRWATFPSASVAWRFSEEEWLRGLGEIGDFKLRVGWGQSGNSAGFDGYISRFFYVYGGKVQYGDKWYKEVHAARNDNPDLRWETTTMLNLGLDFAFLNGRINGTIEYYNKDTKDMIWDYAVPTTIYPVGSLTANVGKMRNRGVELTLNAVPIQTRDWNWTTSLNLSHNKNTVVSVSNPAAGFNAGILDNRYNPNLDGASATCIQRIQEGQSIGTFYMWDYAGINEDGNSCFYVYDKTREDFYGERMVDENGNYVTTTSPEEKDRVKVGNALPWLTMGWNNTLTWKNWDLNLFFTGVFGQKIFNEPKAAFGHLGNVTRGKNILADARNYQYWEQKEDGTVVYDHYSSMPSSRWLEDGSYFKLSTVTLGYTFRNCFNGWLDSIRLYVSANNVFTLTKYSGRDPEINLGGLDPGIDTRHDHYPRARQILVGANINF
ncbi:MAG: TonB-dependent receptor [Muribaculaceae bacterium]|nr:TonB-dependent receptor [Muribaculaceae bacterium]